MSDRHELKTHPDPFKHVLNGQKTFEIRRDDGRGFMRGDTLVLREWLPETRHCSGDYTGRQIEVEVTYLVRAPSWGLTDKMCVMSIRPIDGGAV